MVRCEACVADAGSVIDEDITVARPCASGPRALLAAARRVVVPSDDAAARIRRHFRATTSPRSSPHEDDAAIAASGPARSRCKCAASASSARSASTRAMRSCWPAPAMPPSARLPLEFVVVGHTIDDARLLATGRVFVTGRFAPEEAVALIRRRTPALALLPSVWPETWCFRLTEAWRAGLRVVAFDIGAPAERIRRTGRGFLLPLGLPPGAINNALVAAAGLSAMNDVC